MQSGQRMLERIVNLLAFLLTAKRPMTVSEIRQSVAGYDQPTDEAFRRTFERDKDLIRKLGYPLELRATDAWEVEVGYVVPASRRAIPDLDLNEDELAALWLAAQLVRMGGQPSGPETVFKLGGMPVAGAVEPLGVNLGADLSVLGDLYRAVTERRGLAFDYRQRRRQLLPYGLVHRRGHWYLVGEAPGTGVRSYRVDRMGGLAVGEADTFKRPSDYHLANAGLSDESWSRHGEAEMTATVRFDPGIAWWVGDRLPAGSTRQDETGGAITATIPVANQDAFVGWVLGFADQAEILAPPPLRRRLLDRVGK